MRDYVPPHDLNFDALLLACLAGRTDEPVDPYDALGIAPAWRHYLRDRIRCLRKHGHVIEALGNSGRYVYRRRFDDFA